MLHRVVDQIHQNAFQRPAVASNSGVAALNYGQVRPVIAQGIDDVPDPHRLVQQTTRRQIHKRQRILELQLQTQRVLEQAVEEWTGIRAEILFQAFCLEAQTCERRLRIVGKRREELFHLSMTLLLSSCVVKQRETATDERSDQNAAFP